MHISFCMSWFIQECMCDCTVSFTFCIAEQNENKTMHKLDLQYLLKYDINQGQNNYFIKVPYFPTSKDNYHQLTYLVLFCENFTTFATDLCRSSGNMVRSPRARTQTPCFCIISLQENKMISHMQVQSYQNSREKVRCFFSAITILQKDVPFATPYTCNFKKRIWDFKSIYTTRTGKTDTVSLDF